MNLILLLLLSLLIIKTWMISFNLSKNNLISIISNEIPKYFSGDDYKQSLTCLLNVIFPILLPVSD